jgi:hypothetical protein
VLKRVSLIGAIEDQRRATEHLVQFAPHLAVGHEAKFKGAASWKSFATEKFPQIITEEDYSAARQELLLYGVDRLREELGGFVDEDGELTTGMQPFNIFARVAAGVQHMEPEQEREFLRRQEWLGKEYGKEFVIMMNKQERRTNTAVHTFREETADMTEEEKEATKGKAGMALRHEFLLIKDPRWDWFNILTPGLVPDGVTVEEAIAKITRMKHAVLHYTRSAPIPWSKNIGMFFHCYPHVGVNSLHMHFIDLEKTGPTFAAMAKRNLPVDEVLKALHKEAESNTVKEQEAAMTTEFQNFLKLLHTKDRLDYRTKYFKKLTPNQKERMRRGVLYNTEPLPWRRSKHPLQRLDERLKDSGRPILTFM